MSDDCCWVSLTQFQEPVLLGACIREEVLAGVVTFIIKFAGAQAGGVRSFLPCSRSSFYRCTPRQAMDRISSSGTRANKPLQPAECLGFVPAHAFGWCTAIVGWAEASFQSCSPSL